MKRKKYNPAQIKLLLEDVYVLEDKATEAQRRFQLGKRACERGAKWVDVSKVKLVDRQVYWVRRKFTKKPRFEPIEPFGPALYQWTDSGWLGEGYGSLYNSTSANATVEVWV